MTDLLTSFQDFVRQKRLFAHTDKLLLACSGGVDSTVLAHLLHAEGYQFSIAHMNFRLRGADSDGDAEFVAYLARTLDARFFLKAVDVKKEATKGESTQMTARRLRYDFFADLLQQEGYAYLLTAHHLDDSLETYLMQLLRSSHYATPRGMVAAGPVVRRPLLSSRRQAILDFAQANDISWREDSSNASDDYLRNEVRHHLTPFLAEKFSFTADRWQKTQEALSINNYLSELGADQLRKKYWKNDGEDVIIQRTNTKEETAILFLTAPTFGFHPEQIRQMMAIEGNRVLESPQWQVFIDPGFFKFQRKETTSAATFPEQITVEQLPYFDHRINLSLTERPENLAAPDTLYLTPPTLPLHLRPRRNGDRFCPLGMKGRTKKVQDYFVDEKVPVWVRDSLYLLCNAEDEIMAIPGYCISENFKVKPEDERVLRIDRVAG